MYKNDDLLICQYLSTKKKREKNTVQLLRIINLSEVLSFSDRRRRKHRQRDIFIFSDFLSLYVAIPRKETSLSLFISAQKEEIACVGKKLMYFWLIDLH